MAWHCVLWNGLASLIRCEVSNFSIPLQAVDVERKRSEGLDLSLKLDCNATITWSSREDPGLRWNPLSDFVEDTSPSASSIRIKPFALWFGKLYLRAAAECEGRQSLELVYNVTIPQSERLLVAISGPAAVSAGCDFTMRSESYDPEAPDTIQLLEYDWSCRAAVSSCGLRGSSGVLNVPGGALHPGNYVIVLRVRRGAVTNSAEINLTVGSLEVRLSSTWHDGQLLSKSVVEQTTVSVGSGCNTVASDIQRDLQLALVNSRGFLFALGTTMQRSEGNRSVLAPEAVDIKFDRGETYRFAVTAESSEVFALSPFFRVDLPPSGGRVELQPVNGTMNTAYMLQTTSWDDETTLSYSFYAFPAPVSEKDLRAMNYVDPSSGMYFRKRGGFLVSLGFALELRMAPGNWTAVVRARDGLGQEEIAWVQWTVDSLCCEDGAEEAGQSTDAFYIMSTVRTSASSLGDNALYALKVAAKHIDRPAIEEMASLVSLVSNVTTDAAAGAELLKGLIRLANSTGGADEPMAVAILGAIESLGNTSLELITSLQAAMLAHAKNAVGMVLEGKILDLAAGPCSEIFNGSHAVLEPFQASVSSEPCVAKIAIHKEKQPYGQTMSPSESPLLQLSDYPVSSIELIGDSQVLVVFQIKHESGLQPYCLQLQESGWSTSGADGAMAIGQLYCPVRSPGGIVAVGNWNLVLDWFQLLRQCVAGCFIALVVGLAGTFCHYQFHSREKYVAGTVLQELDPRDSGDEAVLEEVLQDAGSSAGAGECHLPLQAPEVHAAQTEAPEEAEGESGEDFDVDAIMEDMTFWNQDSADASLLEALADRLARGGPKESPREAAAHGQEDLDALFDVDAALEDLVEDAQAEDRDDDEPFAV